MHPLMLSLLALFCFLTPAFGQDEIATEPTVEVTTETTVEEVASPAPEEVEETVEEVTELVEDAISAAESGQWPVLIGLILIVVVTVLRKVGIEKKLPKGSKSLPWLTLGLAVAANTAAALLGELSWETVLWSSIAAAGVAMGGWDLTKLFKKAKAEAPAATEPDEAQED